MKNIIYKYALIALSAVAISSCDLTEEQQSTAGRSMVFGSESGLAAYTYSFYDQLPDYGNAFKQDATAADFAAKNSTGTYESGAYTTNTSTGWSWSALRNINYFIKYNTNEAVSEVVRNNYTGIARLFRAYFYFDKLVTYGEVPWIDEPIASDDSEKLYAPRDTRDVIITKMIEDLDYAFANITASGVTGNSNTVNKWTAAFLKSRVCLFEASWRKYHAGTDYVKNCTITADALFTEAADAARLVMDSGVYSIYTGTAYANGRGSYRELFISDNTVVQEVILACSTDKTLQMGEQNWWYNSSTYGPHLCMTRVFAKTYLNRDGSFYDEKNSDGSYKTFVEETAGRDTRLNQTIRGYDYTRKDASGNYVATAANYTGHTLTGYQFTKYVMDDVSYDDGRNNDNDIPIFRYAEVLLNYAEAKAELGILTDAEWKNTIGVLRRRAGITGGDLDKLPTVTDAYLQKNYYPSISNPVILEIRRERAIELCLEGTRLNDLKRWACGKLWETNEWTGVYIPALDTPLDMNGDGVNDVYITKDTKYSGEYNSILVKLGSTQTVQELADDPNHGYIYWYHITSRVWNDNMYLYPIPQEVRNINGSITQNPGW
ncbi:RagB/SusD family nutrient uptake outer membrane protein [Bacteroides helcogenes]|uniref:RagB/SusD domain protein n=1 Tax=Bacteroides helcogenes (strain ATCC 35417 / DSM 20613 / JCM 6297 / CCUG 15421 / P 36-108) TaxID=693979 RepID=E6SSL6_BACT6|nr:RagB/SusD family nutrient uptake outer membrane protein [Bacteroides helcogenes]ADV42188.1 RagB/SusD domain protein [Bacteroides helcogenes P 36-108]MDY5237558.1 RagB/SusD family nutrient uptake outer membrane protein [Bacteroides helcogenes]